MCKRRTYRGKPTKYQKDVDRRVRQAIVTMLMAIMFVTSSVIAEANSFTIEPQPEAIVAVDDVPLQTPEYNPAGLVGVTDLKKEEKKATVVKTETVKSSKTEVEAKAFIYEHESGNVPCIINGGEVNCEYKGNKACGLGQANPCSKLRNVCNLADVECQEIYWENYMEERYGSWVKAEEFWLNQKRVTGQGWW